MSTTIGIRLQSDASSAVAGLRATAAAAADANEEVEKLQDSSNDALAKMLREQAQEVEKQAAALRKANQQAKERLRIEKEISRLQDLKSQNSLSNQVGTMGRNALAAVPAAVAGGLLYGIGEAMQRGAIWEQGQSRLRVSAGDDFGQLNSAVEQLSTQYGTDATNLLSQADRLMRAGFTSEQAVKSMESAIVASRGEVGKMEGLLDALVEAGTRGYLEEDLLGRMDENSIALRTALQEHLSMTKDELDSALAAGQIDVSAYFDVIDELTGKGTAAQQAAEAALKTTAGQVAQLSAEWDSLLRNFGMVINEGLVDFAQFAGITDKLSEVAGFFRDMKRNRADELISDIHPGYQKILDEEAGPKIAEKTREEIEAEKQLQEQLQANTEEYRRLVLAARDARNAANWDSLSTAEKRATIGQATGLGAGVTQAALYEKIQTDPATAALAAGQTVAAEDLARVQNLSMWREQLANLEKQEAAENAQLERQKEFLEQADRKREMMEAELAGDEEKLRLLQAQEATLRLADQYRAAGLSDTEATQRAAEEVAMQSQLRAASPASPAATATPMTSRGWIQSSQADVGGGGVRLRNYEGQAVKIAQNTEKHTSAIATSAAEILKFLNNSSTTQKIAILA